MARFEKPLVLRVFGYVEPGTAAAAALGTRQPFAFHRGACPSFGPSRSHGFGPGCRRTLLVLDFFGGGGHFSIKNCETIPAQDYLGRPLDPAASSAVRHSKCGFSCWRRSRCARQVDAPLQPNTSNGHWRPQVEPGVARSERLCLPAKPCPYSAYALHQLGTRDAQVKGDGGVIPAVHHPPLQQNSVRLCQIPEEGDKSALLHVITTLLNPVSVFHIDQDLAAFQAGTGGPGGNYRGKRQADAKESPGASGRLEVVAAAGVLVRHIALARRGTSLALLIRSRPRDPPRVLQDQQNPRKPQGRPNSCARTRSGEESGYWKSVPVGGGDYGHPFASEVWTICVPGLLLLITIRK